MKAEDQERVAKAILYVVGIMLLAAAVLISMTGCAGVVFQ